jgi:hypothetical protein
MSIVWADSAIIVAALIEVIHNLITYRVRYGKAWRVKEHALALLWGDWRESYTKVPRLLNAYHTSTQAPDVSSAVVVSDCQTKKVDIIWC